MPVTVFGQVLPLSPQQIQQLWATVRAVCQVADTNIAVRAVSKKEIRRLNARYHGTNQATNILTFSYDAEHDLAVCWPVIQSEASARQVDVSSYTALVITHGLLHVTGLDHEKSPAAAEQTRHLERTVLATNGFPEVNL